MNIFFDCIFGDQFKDLHASILPNSVNPVGGLIFFCWIPPPVVMDHDGGGDEIDPYADRLQGGHENFALRIVCETARVALFDSVCSLGSLQRQFRFS